MFKRIRHRIVTLFLRKRGDSDDPEVLLSQVQREMQEMHARNRERAVQAITLQSDLRQTVDHLERRVRDLQAGAKVASQAGDRVLADQLSAEAASSQATLAAVRIKRDAAIEAVAFVKEAIRREEEHIRRRTAEALSLKAQWKAYQIRHALLDALEAWADNKELSLGDLQAMHAHNRELVVQMITQKNHLQQIVEDALRRINDLQAKAELARYRGDQEFEQTLLAQAWHFDATLAATRESLLLAEQVTDWAKVAIHDEEAYVLRKTAEEPPGPQ